MPFGMVQWSPDSPNGAPTQQSDGSLKNPQSGRCLDDPGSTTNNGTQLQIYDCNGTNAQKWKLP